MNLKAIGQFFQTNKKIILIFLIWIVVVNAFALIALNRFNLKSDTASPWINSETTVQNQQWNIASLHSGWDSYWYLDIAQNGYVFNGPEKLSNIVFFPLYPQLIKVASFVFGGNYVIAGWIVSMIFLLLSLIYFVKLIKEFHAEIKPQLPLMFLLIFPTAFFLNSIYTESLFLFLSIASFYYALKKNFVLAGIFGFFASITRITGLLLFVPLIWEYYKNYKFQHIFNKKLLSIFLIPFGTFIFFIYHYVRFGDFLLFLKVESWWGRSFNINGEHFLSSANPAISNLIIDSCFVLFAFITTYFVFKKLRTSYGLYMLVTLLVALSSGTFMSIGRYILVLFPIYILLASIKNQYLQLTIIFISGLLLSMNIILFVNNYWAG
jgi:hypothetical protein